ncbi:unnamed protein product [Miscanthus lutarioriparius]|uniref:AAA+ ATPase domain-containing protein n=1 Tax=Miscanthus lutarioriparius TaxID=422564 RepID=A0A811PY30_9POAL|nr:unnamed protein product [Miscanthus lutarioriparius]
MNAFLRMISEADQSAIDHLVREWEKQVRELAYDAEDCADTYWLRVRRPMAPPQLPHIIVKWPKYQLEKLLLRRTLAAYVKALLARTTTVSERRVHYGNDRAALPRSPWLAPVSAAASVSANALGRDDPDDQFVGIREQVDTLAERIKADDDDRSLKVFSIVGSGGLGKTTLAVELCRQLEADFQRQALVSVSQAFDGGKDMKGLMATVQADCEPERRWYLIVIDDVWSIPAWEAIRVRLPENKCSSRIIVTTRIETVAKASSVSKDLVHHIKPLDLDDSKKLFVKRVFGSMGGTCPDGLKDIMDSILKKCGGLPLAIVSIASLLASYNSAESVEMWIKVSNSISSQMESHPTLEGMRQMITLSYDYLPHHLKACMMYLSTFPEDYVIAKDRLLYRWIAEGLVAEKRGLTLFDVAEEYLNELISRNMIQPDKLRVTRKTLQAEMGEACRVHDMMLEVMVSKSQDANFVSLVGRQYGGRSPCGKVRRLSVHANDDNERVSQNKGVEQRYHARHGIEAMNLQQVRSLTIFQSEGLEKLLNRLGEFKLLRVLDLEDCKALQDKHMRYVCRLYLLRFLRLTGTRISEMPSEIGDLEYLESLDVGSRMYMLPTVTKLHRLERLRVPWWTLPWGLGNMKALREVDWAQLKGDVQVAREIGELQQLQVLYITVVEEPEEEFSGVLCSSLSKTCALRSLHLYSGRTLDSLLHVSSPPPLLQHLTMMGPISQFPDWISSLKHLAEFSVEWAKLAADQLLYSLCKFPSLQSIRLGMRSCRDRELVARTTHSFRALRILDLYLAGEHPEVVEFEQGSMTKLETLLLKFSDKERRVVGIDNLKSLKEVKLSGWENNPSLQRALQQLKEENKNRPESSQIKVVVQYG